jgi:hypothetical protein
MDFTTFDFGALGDGGIRVIEPCLHCRR